MDWKRFLERAGMVAVFLGGLALLLEGLTGKMPDLLTKLFEFGIEAGQYTIGVQAIVGALGVYIAWLYAKRFF